MNERKQQNIFISYRRDGGQMAANFLYRELLRTLGYTNTHVFFDIKSLQAGMFDERIDDAIELCDRFLLVLTPGCMDRCQNENDWVAHEIRLAHKAGADIIPIAVDAPAFNDWGENLPDDLKFLKRIQQSEFSTDRILDYCLQQLEERLSIPLSERVKKSKNLDSGNFHLTISSTFNGGSKGLQVLSGVVDSGMVRIGDILELDYGLKAEVRCIEIAVGKVMEKRSYWPGDEIIVDKYEDLEGKPAIKGDKVNIYVVGYNDEFIKVGDVEGCKYAVMYIPNLPSEDEINAPFSFRITRELSHGTGYEGVVLSGIIQIGDIVKVKKDDYCITAKVRKICYGFWFAKPGDEVELEFVKPDMNEAVVSKVLPIIRRYPFSKNDSKFIQNR